MTARAGDANPTPAGRGILLAVEGISKRFGGVTAIGDLSLQVREGAIHGLIGPNGAGKTTLFNVLSSLERPDAGRILFRGRVITGLPAHRLASLGIMRTFQNLQLFRGLTVLENVLLGGHAHLRSDMLEALLRLPSAAAEERRAAERAEEILAFMELDHLSRAVAGSLPYGHQRLLEIARALAGAPRLLLLDEPAAGMNPAEKRTLITLLRRIHARGTTLLIVEHNMRLVMELSTHITVLNFGRKLCDGPPEVVRNDPAVIAAYLGTKGEQARGAPHA
ncbi:MAG: ABC transporter ATP-binding protein [Candidatus Tectomicrobia bacterium]|nr:ABC transporter ATP-binding protein [Candidatus Tectomicrobia bacterium]